MTELLVRKINQAKWRSTRGLMSGETPADAVTADLRTSDNRLSLWAVPPDDPPAIDEVVLAMCTSFDALDAVDFIFLEKEKLEHEGIQVDVSPMDIRITKPKAVHWDAVCLDVIRLGKFATMVKRTIDSDQVKRITTSELKNIIRTAIQGNRLTLTDLKENVRRKIEK